MSTNRPTEITCTSCDMIHVCHVTDYVPYATCHVTDYVPYATCHVTDYLPYAACHVTDYVPHVHVTDYIPHDMSCDRLRPTCTCHVTYHNDMSCDRLRTICTRHVTADSSCCIVKERGWVLERGGEGAVIWLDTREP